jgi:glutamyl-tRNA reductase
LVLLDLSFPRTIDPAFKDCRHITLYDLDDLAAKVGAAASESARSLVEDEVSRFTKRLIATRFSPSLANLYVWAEELRNSEVQTALRRLTRLSDREKQVVDVLSRRLVSKLLAPAAVFASGSSESFPQQDRLRALLEIFLTTRKSSIGQTDHRHAV